MVTPGVPQGSRSKRLRTVSPLLPFRRLKPPRRSPHFWIDGRGPQRGCSTPARERAGDPGCAGRPVAGAAPLGWGARLDVRPYGVSRFFAPALRTVQTARPLRFVVGSKDVSAPTPPPASGETGAPVRETRANGRSGASPSCAPENADAAFRGRARTRVRSGARRECRRRG